MSRQTKNSSKCGDDDVATQSHGVKSMSDKEEIMSAIKDLNKSLTSRLDQLENQMCAIVDSVKTEILAVKEELSTRIDGLEVRVMALEEASQGEVSKDNSIANNFVIRNLEEEDRENICEKVNMLLSSELKVYNITIGSVNRKKAFRPNKPGIVVVSCRSSKDKEMVMKSKALLKDSRKYSRVSIDHDKSTQERKQESNMRLLVNTLAKDKLKVIGSTCEVQQ